VHTPLAIGLHRSVVVSDRRLLGPQGYVLIVDISKRGGWASFALDHYVSKYPANEIFLDLDPDAGIRAGERWAEALRRANARCEAVVCLLSKQWESRVECLTEYRTAETLNKRVFCARLEPDTGSKTAAWQWCDLFGDGPQTRVDIGDGDPVSFATRGLYRLRDGIRGAGIGADAFVWPVDEPDRAPYRGWAPFDPRNTGHQKAYE